MILLPKLILTMFTSTFAIICFQMVNGIYFICIVAPKQSRHPEYCWYENFYIILAFKILA